MLRLKIGVRLIRRQGLSGILSVLGLSLGFMVAIYALLYAWAETHYDQHIPTIDRLYLIDMIVTEPGKAPRFQARSPGVAAPLIQQIDGVEDTVRVRRQYTSLKIDDRLDFNEITAHVDRSFIKTMGVKLLSGSEEKMADPSAVFISEDMALRLYGSLDVVGETVSLSGFSFADYQISGVFQNWPEESHIDFDMFTPMQSMVHRGRSTINTTWTDGWTYHYVLLADGADPARIEAQIKDIMYDNVVPSVALPEGATIRDLIEPSLQPLKKLHLNERSYQAFIKPPASLFKLRILSSIALLIVMIACVNYVNMATVRAMRRAREVAVRKILGASRGHLIGQFLAEASLVAGAAFVIALALVELFIGPVSQLIGSTLNHSLLLDGGFLVWMAGLFTLVTLLAGTYPAFLASAYRPHTILSNHSKGGRSSGRLRNFLVVFQFTVSIALAVGAAVIWNQLTYAKDKDLGFNPDNVVILYGVRRDPDDTIRLTNRLHESISGRSGILHVAGAGAPPGWSTPEIQVRLKEDEPDKKLMMRGVSVGLEYFDVLEVSPKAGRLFSESYGLDRRPWEVPYGELMADQSYVLPIVLNMQAARLFGFTSAKDAIGQQVIQGDSADGIRLSEIVGVVDDLHFRSLKTAIEPRIFFPSPAIFNVMIVKLDPNQPMVGVASMEDGWKDVLSQSISQDYLDVTLAQAYQEDESQLRTVAVLAGLGIFVAIIGQYGLASYAAQSRRREIGVRKVLGARIRDILQLFLWQFSKPVLVAMLVAWPLAFLAATSWLEGFAYRVSMSPVWFLIAGLMALLIAMITVAGHALKAARQNPVLALRHE